MNMKTIKGENCLDNIIGRYVWSNAGRDKDRLFVIVGIVDDNHVLVADGDLRRIDNPKKKKLKHLRITQKVAEEISQAASLKKITDKDLQDAVLRYKHELTTVNGSEEV